MLSLRSELIRSHELINALFDNKARFRPILVEDRVSAGKSAALEEPPSNRREQFEEQAL
jgi:hypothetical protein